MIADNLVQADIITKLKSIVAVTNLLGDGVSGIKELEWQGDDFKYPCVRLDLENVGYEFDEQENCGLPLANLQVKPPCVYRFPLMHARIASGSKPSSLAA